MKTQIVQLEPHDDVVSTRDKMGWGTSGRILLVWPEKGHLLDRRLDLVLLQRHSANLGAQLALLTHDRQVMTLARQLGIPVFTKMRKAQDTRWRVPRRKHWPNLEDSLHWVANLPRLNRDSRPGPPPRPLRPLARLAFFTLGVAAFLSIAVVLIPSARLKLTPQTQLQSIHLVVQADPDLQIFQIGGVVPARRVSVTVEGRDSLVASGFQKIGDVPASGQVTFTNATDQIISIPPGSVVLNAGEPKVRFATLRGGDLPAGPGQQLVLPVRALTPGIVGNLPAESLIGIEGLLGTNATVSNRDPTSGGRDRETPAPTAEDRNKLRQQLITALTETARQEILAGLPADSYLLASELVLKAVREEIYQPAQLSPANEISLNLQVEFEAVIASGTDLHALAEAVLDANLPAGYQAQPESMQIVKEGEPDQMSLPVRFERQTTALLDTTTAIRSALGLPPEQAAARLQANLPLQSPPEIYLTPDWWPRLPVMPFRILLVGEQTS